MKTSLLVQKSYRTIKIGRGKLTRATLLGVPQVRRAKTPPQQRQFAPWIQIPIENAQTSWWFQQIWKMWSSIWLISPSRGETCKIACVIHIHRCNFYRVLTHLINIKNKGQTGSSLSLSLFRKLVNRKTYYDNMCIYKWLFIYGTIIWDAWCITALTTITLLLLIKTGRHLNQYKSCMISSCFPMNFHVQCVCLIPRSGSTKKKANKSWTFKITCNKWTCTIRKHILRSLFSVFNDPDTKRQSLRNG